MARSCQSDFKKAIKTESKQIRFHQLDREGDLDWLSDNEVNSGAIQSLERYCSVLEQKRQSDRNNLPLKAAMFADLRWKKLESQTLRGEKGRTMERMREWDSNVSVCHHFSPLLKAVLIIQESNTDSKRGKYEDTAHIF